MLTSTRKWIVILCLTAILFAAVALVHTGVLVATLSPLSLLFSLIACVPSGASPDSARKDFRSSRCWHRAPLQLGSPL